MSGKWVGGKTNIFGFEEKHALDLMAQKKCFQAKTGEARKTGCLEWQIILKSDFFILDKKLFLFSSLLI